MVMAFIRRLFLGIFGLFGRPSLSDTFDFLLADVRTNLFRPDFLPISVKHG